ncbi:nucleoside hydrolase [Nocardioides renjunii]|uniref:nucleoside hydrolase n=1 Tax=Nocardioides renjunii TaxID=3095075 RepID=UPI002B000C65|nr:nucleoside hydrolase [Nocardioides sp. S-34]WQQ22589.1 nucleoside hydrolase [Nocardioides sp. S-34]
MLDVDTGIDDALALLYAAASPALDLCGVTTVVGNVPAGVAARNSAAVLAHAGAHDVPVVTGAARTTSGAGPRTGPTNHGPDGLGGVPVPPVPETTGPETTGPETTGPETTGPETTGLGVADVVEAAGAGGPVTLVGLAPMTNLTALAPLADEVVVLGGELAAGDPPELNAAHDPVATARLLAGDRSFTLYVIDVFERVSVRAEDVARLRSSNRPAARLAGELLAVRRGRLIGDAGALVLLTHPGLFRVEPRRIGLVGDRLTETPDGRWTDVVVDVDAAAAATAYVDALLGPAVPL